METDEIFSLWEHENHIFFALGHLTPLNCLCLATLTASFKVLKNKRIAYFVYEALPPDVY